LHPNLALPLGRELAVAGAQPDSEIQPLGHLTREQSASHCGFVLSTFIRWVTEHLLPAHDPTTGIWNREELDQALEQLCKFGFQPALDAAKERGGYLPLPNVHRVKKKHHYRRGMSGVLPGKPGSPEFMTALIEKEGEYARQQRPSENASSDSPPVVPEATSAPNISAEKMPPPSKVVRAPRLQASQQDRSPVQHDASPGVRPSVTPLSQRRELSDVRPVPRRGLNRIEAAMYVGISPTKFDDMVDDGRMPKPRRIDARKVWDVRELDLAFDALPGEDSSTTGTTWDDR
jgi:predicted DNA-binding transcriptional regulator AlpA